MTYASPMTYLTGILLVAGLALSGTAFAADTGNPDAEKFTTDLVNRGTAILRDGNAGDDARKAQLHQLVLQNVDARKTALFALGVYQRGLDRRAVDQYVAAFSDYITTIYETKITKFRDLDIKIISSLDNGPGDVTVLTQGKPVNDRKVQQDPIVIGLRLNGPPGRYKIVDVQIAGIWVSQDQRERFADMLSKNSNIASLTGYLADQTAQIKSGTKKI